MKLRVFSITDQATLEPLPDQELSAAWPLDPIHRWIDIENPTAEELTELLAPLELHDSILRACIRPERSARFISHRNALYLELSTHLGWDEIEKPYLSVLCLTSTIITIHRDMSHTMAEVISGVEVETPLIASTTFAVLYYLMVEIGKQNVDAALDVRQQAEVLDQTFSERPDELDPNIIADLRRRVSHCASVHDNNTYCSAALLTVETAVFHGSRQPVILKDILQLSELSGELIDGARARVDAVQDDYELALQHRVENRLRFLTVLSAVFLPLTLISAVYGMNFNNLPALHWQNGYLVVIAMMMGTAGATAALFYWLGWFD